MEVDKTKVILALLEFATTVVTLVKEVILAQIDNKLSE